MSSIIANKVFNLSGLQRYDNFESNPSRNLKGLTIFISGASRGIGLEMAKICAKDGCYIAIAAKTAEPHPKLPGTIYTAAKEIKEAGALDVLPIICDIRFENQVKNAIQKTVDKFGGIDIIINNASAISPTKVIKTTMKKYDLMNNVNVRGTFLVCKYAIPYLMKSKMPRILTMSPPPIIEASLISDKIAYSLSKYGMSIVTIGLSKELKKYKVGCNTLWPRTPIATSAIKYVLGGDPLMKISRNTQIQADTAYLILTQNHKFTGNTVMDEDLLRQAGINDFSKYKFDSSVDEQSIPNSLKSKGYQMKLAKL